EAIDGAESRIADLQDEALYLCSIVCKLLPAEPEALGLQALMHFCTARRTARVDAQGNFTPLAQQDTAMWDRDAILQSDQLLWVAAQQRRPGPFQLEAAVQSAHCHRLMTGQTPWRGIAQLYRQINAYFPTQGALVAGAVAMGEAGDPAAGLYQLDQMDGALTKSFQPWWVARGHLLQLSGDRARAMAHQAYQTAIGLTTDPRVRRYLESVQAGLT
ncbi:MAG: RNA polymerase subunit sigma-70, partial [Burkholderiales bacterium PBB4]